MQVECQPTGKEKVGGIIFDEMTIQPGIQLQPWRAGPLEMFGYGDFGEGSSGVNCQQENSETL